MDHLKKSFRKHARNFSGDRSFSSHHSHEELPMLLNQSREDSTFMVDLADQGEVFVKIDSVKSPSRNMDQPPPPPERGSRGETALEMGSDMDKETNRSDESKDSLRPRQGHADAARMSGGERDGTEVVKCSSSSFQRRQTMFKVKTKSRLNDDSPEEIAGKSEKLGKSGFLSGMMGKTPDGEDDDDPFIDEDLPDDVTQSSFSCMTFLQWVGLISVIAALICTVRIPSMEEKTFLDLDLWKWEVLVLVLICGRLLSGWLIRVIVFFIEWNFLLRKRVLYFVYGLRRAVQNCFWLGLFFIAWLFLFDERLERENENVKYITRVLECLVFTFVTWLIKTMMVKVMASNFHVSTYFDRIQESLFNQYVIEALSGPPFIELNKAEKVDSRFANEVKSLQKAGATIPPGVDFSAGKSGRLGDGGAPPNGRRSGMLSQPFSRDGDDGIHISSLHKMNTKNVSAWSMKRLMKIVRHGALSTLDEQLLESSYEDESATMIRSEREAKAAARKIFQNVAKPGYKYIYLDDVMRFMPEEDAMKTMSLFEGPSEAKRISKSSLKSWLVNAFRDRRALALTLNDTKTAVNKLHNVINIMVGILIAVVWVIILGITTTDFVFFISSQLILVAFIFGNTCRMIFEAIIFLFVIHPFDVGDRCEIDGVPMVVEEMNILTTIFLRWDNQKILYPNSTLASKHIANFYRSPDMDDAIEFCVHVCTPAEKMAVIRQKIISFFENNKEHWHRDPLFVFKNVEMLNMVRFAIWPSHTMNFQNVVERWQRRELLVQELVKILKEHDIQYRLLPVDINVCAMPPASSPLSYIKS